MTRTHRATFNLLSGPHHPISRLVRLVQIVHATNTFLTDHPPILLALQTQESLGLHPSEQSPVFGEKVVLFGTEESLLALSQYNQRFMQNAYFVEKGLELPDTMSLVRRVRPRRNQHGVFENTKDARWITFPSVHTRQQMVLCFEDVQADIATCTATSYGTCKS